MWAFLTRNRPLDILLKTTTVVNLEHCMDSVIINREYAQRVGYNCYIVHHGYSIRSYKHTKWLNKTFTTSILTPPGGLIRFVSSDCILTNTTVTESHTDITDRFTYKCLPYTTYSSTPVDYNTKYTVGNQSTYNCHGIYSCASYDKVRTRSESNE